MTIKTTIKRTGAVATKKLLEYSEVREAIAKRQGVYDPGLHPFWARSLIGAGYKVNDLPSEMNVTAATIKRWLMLHEEFAAAIAIPTSANIALVENALRNRALGVEYEEETVITEYESMDLPPGVNPDELSPAALEAMGIGIASIKRSKYKKHLPGDVAAQVAFLKAYNPNRWDPSVKNSTPMDASGNPIQPPTVIVQFSGNITPPINPGDQQS